MIKDTRAVIKERIARACISVGRDPGVVTLVAVAKHRTSESIREAIEAGLTDIGENKVQEALLHYRALRDTPYAPGLRWHLIGHLQTNKAKDAVRIFDLIHSVDSLRLAEELNRQAAKINKIQDILVEVNTSGEENKFGVIPVELEGLLKAISALNNVRLQGLMTMAPVVDHPGKARPSFTQLRNLLETANVQLAGQCTLQELSMGMSADFEVAVEEGATIVRIGRAIFER